MSIDMKQKFFERGYKIYKTDEDLINENVLGLVISYETSFNKMPFNTNKTVLIKSNLGKLEEKTYLAVLYSDLQKRNFDLKNDYVILTKKDINRQETLKKAANILINDETFKFIYENIKIKDIEELSLIYEIEQRVINEKIKEKQNLIRIKKK